MKTSLLPRPPIPGVDEGDFLAKAVWKHERERGALNEIASQEQHRKEMKERQKARQEYFKF